MVQFGGGTITTPTKLLPIADSCQVGRACGMLYALSHSSGIFIVWFQFYVSAFFRCRAPCRATSSSSWESLASPTPSSSPPPPPPSSAPLHSSPATRAMGVWLRPPTLHPPGLHTLPPPNPPRLEQAQPPLANRMGQVCPVRQASVARGYPRPSRASCCLSEAPSSPPLHQGGRRKSQGLIMIHSQAFS